MVILTLWLYRLEHDEEPATEEELAMYNKLRNLFDDDSVDVYGAKLSSTVARLWGSMIDEVVVWGYVHPGLAFLPYVNVNIASPSLWVKRSSSIHKPSLDMRTPCLSTLAPPRLRWLLVGSGS
jgi:hypothetical protein